MDVNNMIAELREEHSMLGQAISALEVLSLGGKKRRGRPPKWAVEAATNPQPAVKRRGRPPGSKNKPRVDAPEGQ
jgi:hypothetical protein